MVVPGFVFWFLMMPGLPSACDDLHVELHGVTRVLLLE